MSLVPGSRLGHYVLGTPLGAGGMGEVYRASDTKLGRDVALKLLPADLARDADRLARFQREARAVAALNHPHIITIYSVEEATGVHFFTMELVEGQALDRLIPEGGLSGDRLVPIAVAITDALVAAHDRGIVHRDLKPANVMVTPDGRVKVLDFGLAKLGATGATGATGAENVPADETFLQTRDGIVMGTVPYMSPEQVAGRAIDHRTDIFSLGVMLYEMASGKRPFEGASSIELASSILRDTPAPITDRRSDLPATLAPLIQRCLEKDPDQRIQTAREIGDLCRDLTRQPSSSVAASPAVPPPATSGSGAVRQDEGFWVAILPFRYAGSHTDLVALAEGLSEEVVTGLSRFAYLRVISRGATLKYINQPADPRLVGKEIGARYVLEGSLRHAGSQLRIVVQLTDAESGAHLWAETYHRPFQPEAIFELQDDLVPRIVSTIADWYGILPRSMSEAVRSKPVDRLSPYEALLRAFGYFERVTPDEHAVVRLILERAVERAPGHATAWAMLSMLYGEEHRFGWNARPDPLGRSLQAARRAAEAAPSSHVSHLALAQAHYFRKEIDAFRNAAERALSLNPMDGAAVEYISHLLAFAGDWERGCHLGETARQLNPNHPPWYWALPFLDAYRRRDYHAARDLLPKAYMPGQHFSLALFAALRGQLGEREVAAETVRELLALRPDFAAIARDQFGKWYLPELVEHLIDGLRKAGLDVPASTVPVLPVQTPRASSATDSGAARTDEGFWVAVLPFKHAGTHADLAMLAEGLSEDIVTGLSRFSYLRVIARGSTRDVPDATDARSAGETLGARYVVEGSLRQAGSQLRVAVKVVDTTTGAHLWANTYDLSFDANDLFALQDDLVPRIVSTVADAYGVLPHSMSQSVRSKPFEELTPYEALLRSLSYAERVTPEEHAKAKAALERALEQSPAHSDCWAMLSIMLADEYGHGFGASRETLDRALKAARRAVDANPSNHRAYQALAWALFLRKEFPACRQAGERALALNPMDACTAVYVGQTLAYSGDWERGCSLIARAIELNPHHPGWYWYASFLNAYRQRNYEEALGIAFKMNLPGVSLVEVALAAAAGQLGDRMAAGNARRELLTIKPDYAVVSREELGKWFEPEIVEHLIEGLRKAGLEVT